MKKLCPITLIAVGAIMFVFLMLMAFGALAQTSPPLTEKIGDMYITFNDSTKRNEFFAIFNQQGCPANIYIHDTMWQWGDGVYMNVPDPNPRPPVFIHDTLYLPKFVHDTVNICPTPPPSPSLATIFTTQTLPTSSATDGQPITLGVKFRLSATAYMKAIRFYKVLTNTGQHKGYLYSSAGAILDSGTFVESPSGWQTLQLTKNILLTAGTTYIAAYYSPTGQYSSTNNGFNSGITNGIMTAPASVINDVNGVYNYGNKFPTLTYLNSNYWVDGVVSQSK